MTNFVIVVIVSFLITVLIMSYVITLILGKKRLTLPVFAGTFGGLLLVILIVAGVLLLIGFSICSSGSLR